MASKSQVRRNLLIVAGALAAQALVTRKAPAEARW